MPTKSKAKKAAKKGRAKSAETGQFVKKDFAAKNKATTFTTKPSKNDGKIRLIKKILKSEYMDFIKLAKIEELVYKK